MSVNGSRTRNSLDIAYGREDRARERQKNAENASRDARRSANNLKEMLRRVLEGDSSAEAKVLALKAILGES